MKPEAPRVSRREALIATGSAVLSGSMSAPAIAQQRTKRRWRLTSSFPKSLDTIFGASEHFIKRVNQISEGELEIQLFAAGEIVPGLQALDAVSSGTVEMAHTGSYYYVGKDEAFAFATSIPFGLNSRQQSAWLYHGGGIDLCNEFYKTFNVLGLPMGNTGAQMGGWFRREIRTADDLRGLKFRIGGYAGRILSRLGVVPQQMAAGDIYPALERGTIDAVEWVGPYDDEKLGFVKVAPFYYAPGWWEGSTTVHLFIGLEAWNNLPDRDRSVIRAAAAETDLWMQAKYDAVNPLALRRLVAAGAQIRFFSREILDACFAATGDALKESAGRNQWFQRFLTHWSQFRGEQYTWFRVNEYVFDSYVYAQQEKR